MPKRTYSGRSSSSYSRSAKRYRRPATAYRAKRALFRRATTVNRVPLRAGIIAHKSIVTMKYCQTYVKSTGSSNFGLVQYRLNDINDPDVAVGGHQPYGHDTYQALYHRYRVFAVGYKITTWPNGGSNLEVGVAPVNSGNTYTSSDVLMLCEQAGAQVKPIAAGASGGPAIIRGKVSLPKLTGQTSSQYKAGDKYQAIFGSGPSEAMTLNIWFSVPSGAVAPSSADATYKVELTYYVECFDPLQVGAST